MFTPNYSQGICQSNRHNEQSSVETSRDESGKGSSEETTHYIESQYETRPQKICSTRSTARKTIHLILFAFTLSYAPTINSAYSARFSTYADPPATPLPLNPFLPNTSVF